MAFGYKIPSANEAIVVTGRKSQADAFKILTGKGAFVFPFFSRSHRLSLDSRESSLNEQCVTSQGIPVGVQAVAVFKVANSEQGISNAARRFVDQQEKMPSLVGLVLAGHLRSIVGGMTVEEIVTNRNRLAQETKDSSSAEMENMGLAIDSFQITQLADPTGYIEQMAKPHQADNESRARIAAAAADQAAAEKEQEAIAAKAGFSRDASIATANAKGQSDAAEAEAAQQGPLSQAKASLAVQEANTELALKQAEVTEAELESSVRKPADAQKYATVTTSQGEADAARQRADASQYTKVKEAEGDRDSAKARAEGDGAAVKVRAEGERDATKAKAEGAEAEATSIKVVGLATAEATRANAEALNGVNLQNQVATRLAEKMPEIVEAVAGGLRGSNLTILNGADGVGQTVASVLGQGLEVYRTLMHGTTEVTESLKTGAGVAPSTGADAAPELAGRLDEMAGKGNK